MWNILLQVKAVRWTADRVSVYNPEGARVGAIEELRVWERCR